MTHHQHFPFGSARFASDAEIIRTFRKSGGVPFAHYRGYKLHHSAQAGMLLIGGAGSGKFTSVLAHIMNARPRTGEAQRYAIFDPKRELRAVLGPYFAHIGAAVYEINPYATHGVTGDRLSLLSHLAPCSPRLVADCRRVARTLLPEGAGGDAQFFDQKGQGWLEAIIRGLVHMDGGVSPASIYQLVCLIRADPDAWVDTSKLMAAMGEPDLAVIYAEMQEMSEDSRRTFDSVMGGITNALAFMNDPKLQEAFVPSHSADFSLDVLMEASSQPVFVFFVMPPELTSQNAALIRQFFSTLRTLKQERLSAPTLNLIIDEAAQLGSFAEIAEFYAIGRGFGLCPVTVYQDIGQIKKNLGPTGAMSLSASSDLEVYLGGGISDLETARHLSQKLGNQTLEVADSLTQVRAERGLRDAIYEGLFGKTGAMKTGFAMKSLAYERDHMRKQARALRTPDEILRMSRNEALVMPSGYGIPPFMADKRPYFTLPEYTGLYAPNPCFDADPSRISVPARFGRRKSLRVIRERVPASHAHLPQYKSGHWSFIQGHRPT